MEFDIKIYDDISHFYLYKDIISSLPNFKVYERDIKLISLLEDRKVQFDIEQIRSNNSCFFGKYLKSKSKTSLLEIASLNNYDFKINSMCFILKDNKVVNLKCDISILNNTIDINKSKTSLRILMINDKIGNFYLFDDLQN